MKNTMFILMAFLCSCSRGLDESNINVEVAAKSLESLLSMCLENGGYFSGEVEYSEPIGIKHSHCNESGAYIKYGGFFVEEYGLYMPAKGVRVTESNGTDPSYKKISGTIYSFRIRG